MRFKKIVSIFVVSVIFTSIVTGVGFYYAVRIPIVNQSIVSVDIEKGDSFNRIIEKLREQGLPIQPFLFKLLALSNNSYKKIKTGEYQFDKGLNLQGILSQLVQGKTKRYGITFPEGWTFKQMLQKIASNPSLQHTLPAMNDPAFTAKLGLEYSHPEGGFFPDTYFFDKQTTDVALLKRAQLKMQTILQQEWQNKADNLPFKTPYEALILASIVEKETAASEERPKIAGVFIERLNQAMPLQTDPTVIYGMGDSYAGDIKSKDLLTVTPYNTYVIKGLPPTPIAMPGRAAISAVLHPERGHWLYFVARGDGTHVFSSTLAEHNAAVETYQRNKP